MNFKKVLLTFLLSLVYTVSFCQDGSDYDTFFKGAEKFEKFAADVLEDQLLDGLSPGESIPTRFNSFVQGELLSAGGSWLIGDDISQEMDQIIQSSVRQYELYPKRRMCDLAASNPAGWTLSHIKNLRVLRGMANIAYNLVTKDIPGAPALAARLVEAPTRAAYEQIRKQLESQVQSWWQSGRPSETFKWTGTWDLSGAECDISYSVLWNKEKESYLYQLSGDCNCEPARIPFSPRSVTLESFQILGGGQAIIEIQTAGFDSETQSDPQAVLRVRPQHFKMQTDCDCDEEEENDNIDSASATFQPDAGEPSENVTITLTAKDPAGRNIDIHGVDITGLEAIMEEGADYNVVTTLPAKNVDVQFTIANPREDDLYGLDIELTDFEGVTTTINPEYEVLNVEPEIVSVENNSASADPGETMALDGVKVTLIDRNADENNESEVTTNRIAMSEKPRNLNTVPDFNMFDQKSQTSFEPETGTYVFELSRSGRVNNPHEHGSFQNEFSIQDDDEEEVRDVLSYVVNNVPPVIERTSVEPRRFLHSGDPIEIRVHLTIRDNNGYKDIDELTIDATAAAGENLVFQRNDGIQEDELDNKRVSFSTEEFVHTQNPDQHPIPITVTDKPDENDNFNTVNGTDFINVGNEKPEIGTTGYIWGGNEDEELTITPANRRVCPGEEITVGVRAADPESDPLRVTATLNGNEIELEAQPGGTYTGMFTAPPPGVYTIQFEAQETVFDEQFADPSSLQLTVDPCEEDEEEEQNEDQQMSSGEPVEDLPDEPNPQPTNNTNWDFDFETYRVGLNLGYETRYHLEDEVCNQEELDRCEATNGSSSIGFFVETDAIDNLKLPGTNTDLSLAIGFRFKRASTDYTQMYSQGSGYPYRVDGKVSFTSAGLYSKFSAPLKDGFPMKDSKFETSFNVGFNYTWNEADFDNQLFPSGSELNSQSRSHQNLNFTTGAGMNVNWNPKIGTGLGVYWSTDGGGADALFGIRASANYNF